MPATKAKVTSYKMGAVIPTTQYGNLQPEFELEGGTLSKMKEEGLKHIQEIWDEYGSSQLSKNSEAPKDGIEFEQKLSFTGEKVLWSEYLHEYRSLDGKKLTSGSKYADLLTKPFNSELLSEKSGNAWGVDKDDLAALWKLNGRIATEYGSSVHTALEAYMRYHEMGSVIQHLKDLDDNYALPKNEYIKKAVTSFVELFGTFDEVEVFVTDVKNNMAGQIDGLKIVDLEKKICKMGDYKTNFEMKKAKLTTYGHQMNFYRTALENNGWTVETMDLYHWNGETWKQYPVERQDIDLKLFSK